MNCYAVLNRKINRIHINSFRHCNCSDMNIFIIFLIICGSRITYSRSYGKEIYGRNSYFKSGSLAPTINKDTPYQTNKISSDVIKMKHPISRDISNQGVFISKKNTNPMKVYLKYKGDQISQTASYGQDASLSTKIKNYLIKVSSKQSQIKPNAEKFEAFLPLNFNHVIEIVKKKKDTKSWRTESVAEFASETTADSDITIHPTMYKDLEKNLDTSKQTSSEILNTDITNIKNDQMTEVASEDQSFTLSDQLDGSGEEINSNDEKSARLMSIFSRQNTTSQVCTTPKGETGRCRRFRHCLLSDALNDFNVLLQHLCLIRGALVGVCCPDNPVIEITNPDKNSAESETEMVIQQPPEGCGLNTKTRIVGGTISVPHEWLWTVALMRRQRFYCGGVIINNWYVLTAAHCILGIDVKDLTVRLGEFNFSVNNEHNEDISVAEVKRHAQFVTLTFQHDIALLKLQRRIRYTKFVGSICLPTSTERDYSDVNGTVVGWGTVSFGGAASPVLRQVTIPVWKNEDCDRTYMLEDINDSFLCAGSPEKGEDACQGDSGGPLMTLNDRGRWEVIGIVSWGRRCGDPTYPGVYTRITTYLDWISQNAN